MISDRELDTTTITTTATNVQHNMTTTITDLTTGQLNMTIIIIPNGPPHTIPKCTTDIALAAGIPTHRLPLMKSNKHPLSMWIFLCQLLNPNNLSKSFCIHTEALIWCSSSYEYVIWVFKNNPCSHMDVVTTCQYHTRKHFMLKPPLSIEELVKSDSNGETEFHRQSFPCWYTIL